MLGKMPISLSDDEIREIVSSYTLAHSGRDIFGNFLPLSINMDSFTYGPLSIYLSSLFFIIFPLTIFFGRLPYALAGIVSVVSLYFIVKKLIGNERIAFLACLTMIFSNWALQVSRVAYDAGMALMFYLIAINIFLRLRKHTILLTFVSLLVFFIAFYSYVATRVVFLPLMLSLAWYKYKDLTKRQLFVVSLFVIFTFGSFGALSVTSHAAQYVGGQFFFQNKQQTSLAVELERRASRAPQLLKEAYHNKFSYWASVFTTRYTYIFSPQYLFISGESNIINSLPGRGELYLIEAPLIALGLLYLFAKKRREMVLVLLFLLIAPLPSGIGGAGATYVTRSVFFIPWMYVLTGAGIYSISYFVNKKIAIGIYVLILSIYVVSVTGYFFQYYYNYRYYGAKYFSKSTQDLVYFIDKNQKIKNQIIIAGGNDNTILHYAFYNTLTPSEISAVLNGNPTRYKNITFKITCLNNDVGNPHMLLPKSTLYVSPNSCHKLFKPNAVIKSYDQAEVIWKIYEN